MRIGILTPGFSSDAADWAIPALQHLVALLARRHDVRVLATRYPHRRGRYELLGAEVIPLGGAARRGLGSAQIWLHTLRVLRREHQHRPFDLLHAFWANEAGMLAALAGRLLDLPALVSIAGGELVGFQDIGYGGQLSRIERLKTRLALSLATVVTGGSAYLLELARLSLPRTAGFRLAPLGVSTDLFYPEGQRVTGGPARLIHVASLTPAKDQDTLLYAVADVISRGLQVQLDVIGEGPRQGELQSLAASLDLASVIQFHGKVRHDQLGSCYRRADLFVLSSRHEAQCMAVLEAAACGLPVVGTAVGVVAELAPQAGIAVPVGSAAGLADGISSLLRDRPRRLEMGQRALERVKKSYDLQVSTDRFEKIYQQIRDHRP